MRKYIVICSLLAVSISLSACSVNSEDVQTEIVTEETTVYEMKDGDTVITGEVDSIVGNEVTLSLGTLTENENESDSEDSSSEDNADNADNNTSESGEMPSFDGENAPDMSGEMPDMGSGEMPEMPSGDMGGGDFTGGKKSSGSIEKTGETDTYIIPVGMTVSGISGRSSDYSAISAGDILKITVDSDNTVKAVEVV